MPRVLRTFFKPCPQKHFERSESSHFTIAQSSFEMAAVANGTINEYEEARKQRLEENKKRFQDLGISIISRSLSELTNSERKSKQRMPKPKPEHTELFEPRRSSRARNPVRSYRDDVEIEFPSARKRSRSYSSSWESYVARPLEEVRLASYEERNQALRAAEKFQSSIQSGNPSFVKSMGLPTQFCKDHLPPKDSDMILEDENGSEVDAKYLGKRTGLSGGWRGFALDHKLDDGDAVVFELVEPERFKVYIFRVSSVANEKDCVDITDGKLSRAKHVSKGGTKNVKKLKAEARSEDELLNVKRLKPDTRSEDVDQTQKNVSVSQEHEQKGKSANDKKAKCEGKGKPASGKRAKGEGKGKPANDKKANCEGKGKPADDKRAKCEEKDKPADDKKAKCKEKCKPADDKKAECEQLIEEHDKRVIKQRKNAPKLLFRKRA